MAEFENIEAFGFLKICKYTKLLNARFISYLWQHRDYIPRLIVNQFQYCINLKGNLLNCCLFNSNNLNNWKIILAIKWSGWRFYLYSEKDYWFIVGQPFEKNNAAINIETFIIIHSYHERYKSDQQYQIIIEAENFTDDFKYMYTIWYEQKWSCRMVVLKLCSSLSKFAYFQNCLYFVSAY